MPTATDLAEMPENGEPDGPGQPNQGVPPLAPAEGGDDVPAERPGSPGR